MMCGEKMLILFTKKIISANSLRKTDEKKI